MAVVTVTVPVGQYLAGRLADTPGHHPGGRDARRRRYRACRMSARCRAGHLGSQPSGQQHSHRQRREVMAARS
jgi:hypothetical protein